MSRQVGFENHLISERLKESIQITSEVRAMDNVPDEDEVKLDRIHFVLHTFESLLNKADPFLISTGTLDSLVNNVDAIISYIHEYKRSKAAGQLLNALANIDVLCNNLRNIYIPTGSDDIENMKEAILSFRRSLSQHLHNASRETEEQTNTVKRLLGEIEELRKRIESERNRVDSITTDFQRQFSEAEEKRRSVYNETAEERAKEFKEKLDLIQSEADQLSESLQMKFEILMKDFSAKSEALIHQIDSEHLKTMGKVEEIHNTLLKYQQDGKEILGQMSIDSHAAGYKREADKARIAKNWWHGATAVFFLALILSALWNSQHTPADVHWTGIASKWIVTLAISAATTYFAKQATKQDIVERENRNMELQLATINPYLEIFDESERKDIKKQLVDRIFTGVRESKESDEKSTASISVGDVTKIVEVVAGVAKRN